VDAIILVDRGDCTFVTKVRNIEHFGGRMALISDSYTEISEDLIMADDGTGHNINIPSFIIRKADGDNIKNYLNDGPSSTEQ
jgi:hypothetical protein